MASPHFKQFLLSHLPDNTKYLIGKSEDLVFNYKNKAAEKDLHYMLHFYSTLDEQVFASEIVSQCQFRAARGADALPTIQKVVEQISFEMSADTAAALVNDLLTRDWLINNETIVTGYLAAIARKVKAADGQAFAAKCIAGYFMKYYLDNRTELKFTFEQRLGVFRIQCEAYRVLAERKAAVENNIKQYSEAFVDFLINVKEDSEVLVPSGFADLFNKHCQPEWFCSAIETQLSKITTAAQASFFGSLKTISASLKE